MSFEPFNFETILSGSNIPPLKPRSTVEWVEAGDMFNEICTAFIKSDRKSLKSLLTDRFFVSIEDKINAAAKDTTVKLISYGITEHVDGLITVQYEYNISSSDDILYECWLFKENTLLFDGCKKPLQVPLIFSK